MAMPRNRGGDRRRGRRAREDGGRPVERYPSRARRQGRPFRGSRVRRLTASLGAHRAARGHAAGRPRAARPGGVIRHQAEMADG